MNHKIQSLLLPFYFGSVDDNERLIVERELLTDSEVLVDYLDLKRSVEVAPEFSSKPSNSLLNKLSSRFENRRRFFWSLSIGAAVAASVFVAVLVFRSEKSAQVNDTPASNSTILFDSRGELPANSNVL